MILICLGTMFLPLDFLSLMVAIIHLVTYSYLEDKSMTVNNTRVVKGVYGVSGIIKW